MEQFVTITGCGYYKGFGAIKVGDKLCLVKNPSNEFDPKAIAVCNNLSCSVGNRKKLDKSILGHIAQSSNTIVDGTLSANEIYDSIGNCGKIEVMFKTNYSIIARIIPYF